MKTHVIVISMLGVLLFAGGLARGAFDYIVSDVYFDAIRTLNNQSVQVTGTGVKEIVANGSSYIEVQNTLPLEPHVGGIGHVDLKNTSAMKFYKGQINTVTMFNSSSLNLSGGEILTDLYIGTFGGEVKVSSGYISNFRLSGSVVANLSGGQIDNIALINISPGTSITFIADIDSLTLTYNEHGNLIHASGNWLDGSSFNTNINAGIHHQYIQFVPEPLTFVLMVSGALLVRRKR